MQEEDDEIPYLTFKDMLDLSKERRIKRQKLDKQRDVQLANFHHNKEKSKKKKNNLIKHSFPNQKKIIEKAIEKSMQIFRLKKKKKRQTKQQHFHFPKMQRFQLSILDTDPRICVSQRNESSCQLYPCDTIITPTTILHHHDDFGFLLYNSSNARGFTMRTSGTALAGSGCLLSHRYKFIYIHILKSAGMTIKSLFKRALCHGSTTMPCQAGSDILQVVNCAPTVRKYGANYLVFSFVRNPFGRFYSGYAMADRGRRRGRGSMPPFTFQQFANMTNRQRRYASTTSPSHYVPQIRFITDKRGCPVVDYIGRLERFQHDMNVVIRQINSTELTAYWRNHSDIHNHETAFGKRLLDQQQGNKGGSGLASAYGNRELIQRVALEYAADFEFFGYDNSTIPS